MPETPESRLENLGYVLPEPLIIPPDLDVPLSMIRIIGKRVLISGHGPQMPDGGIAQPLGQVGAEVSEDDAKAAAHLTALSMVGTLKRELGELDRIGSWVRVFGMVNSAPGFVGQTPVINAFSNTIIEIFGRDAGMATRSAVGMAALPFGIPVEVEAECELK